MPSQDRVRLYHPNCSSEVRPEPDQPSQNDTIHATQAQSSRRLPQGNIELVAKKQILGLKPSARLKQVTSENRDSPNDRMHRLRS
jgi:hypothetical protein